MTCFVVLVSYCFFIQFSANHYTAVSFYLLNTDCHNWIQTVPPNSLCSTIPCLALNSLTLILIVGLGSIFLFFLASFHCSKYCHTPCFFRAVLILSSGLLFVCVVKQQWNNIELGETERGDGVTSIYREGKQGSAWHRLSCTPCPGWSTAGGVKSWSWCYLSHAVPHRPIQRLAPSLLGQTPVRPRSGQHRHTSRLLWVKASHREATGQWPHCKHSYTFSQKRMQDNWHASGRETRVFLSDTGE